MSKLHDRLVRVIKQTGIFSSDWTFFDELATAIEKEVKLDEGKIYDIIKSARITGIGTDRRREYAKALVAAQEKGEL